LIAGLNARAGLIYSGSFDTTVRVWNSKECLPSVALGASEDPVLNFLEKKLSGSKAVGSGSRSNLRFLSDCICTVLALKPRWRRGVISSFFDGKSYATEFRSEALVLGIEIIFQDSSVQIFNNRLLLRNLDEISLR